MKDIELSLKRDSSINYLQMTKSLISMISPNFPLIERKNIYSQFLPFCLFILLTIKFPAFYNACSCFAVARWQKSKMARLVVNLILRFLRKEPTTIPYSINNNNIITKKKLQISQTARGVFITSSVCITITWKFLFEDYLTYTVRLTFSEAEKVKRTLYCRLKTSLSQSYY